jgi:predicted transcriptional regulator
MLPHGSIGKIAKKVGCSRATVEHVIRGKSDHPGVIEEILEIIKHKESYKEALTKKIEEVVNGR